MTPRQQIASVGFAVRAGVADTVPDGAITATKLSTGAVTIDKLADGVTLSEMLDDDGSGSGLDADYLDNHSADYFMPAATDNWVNQSGDTMTGPLALTTDGTAINVNADLSTGTLYGIRVDADQNSTTTSYSAYGLYSDTDSAAPGGYTYGTHSTGMGDGVTYGLYAHGESASSTAYGLYSGSMATTGVSYGVYISASQANNSTSPNNNDVYGIKEYSYAYGSGNLWGARNYVYHYGTAGGNTYGLQALASGSDTGTAYGIHAIASNADKNYAGYFETEADTGIPVVGLQSSAYTLSDLSEFPAWEPGGFFGGRNGVIAYTEENNGYGVFAKATGDYTRALNAAAEGNYGYGVRATADGLSPTAGYFMANGDGAYGLKSIAYANGTDEDKPYGIAAYAYGTNGYAGYFYASGTDAVGVYGQGTAYAGDFYGDVWVRGSSTLTSKANSVWIDSNEDANGPSLKLFNSDGNCTIELDAGYGGAEGYIITDAINVTGGSDLSEQFDVKPADVEITPGMVVSIDPDNPGNLLISTAAYDNKVVGIISGANGIKTGMMMGQRGTEADGKHPVALTGRVYCWADASRSPIRPGDLLTTSSVPGHAMKVNDHSKANGAILGKAMTALSQGRGMVLVLVSLQ